MKARNLNINLNMVKRCAPVFWNPLPLPVTHWALEPDQTYYYKLEFELICKCSGGLYLNAVLRDGLGDVPGDVPGAITELKFLHLLWYQTRSFFSWKRWHKHFRLHVSLFQNIWWFLPQQVALFLVYPVCFTNSFDVDTYILRMSAPPNNPLLPGMTTAIWSTTAYLACALFLTSLHIWSPFPILYPPPGDDPDGVMVAPYNSLHVILKQTQK